MQKVAAYLPSWDRTKTTSKKGFDKVWTLADKLGAPVNRLSNKIGSEAFWPTTLDKESYKAARILRSFCKDGFYAEEEIPAEDSGPKQKQHVLKRIPPEVIKNAAGLAIFTTMRTGLWVSGAGGSGVLVARKDDGEWSEPSGILLHTAGLGFLVGVDIYDCVLVINNRKALDAFTKIRATVGGEISAVAGPVGVGGVLENDGKWKQANRPVFTYLKSRGFYAGVQVDGSIIIERSDENARFYNETLGVSDILAGKVRHRPPELKMLMETLKAAEGRTDVDASLMGELESMPAPADVDVEVPADENFGIPEPDDPDPYGVHALEKEGLEIREAGTRSRPTSEQFEYHPSPTSPVYAKMQRRSMEASAAGTRSNRNSTASYSSRRWSTDRPYAASDAGTQTDDIPPATPSLSRSSNSSRQPEILEEEEEHGVEEAFVDAHDGGKSDTPGYGNISGGNPWKRDLEHDDSEEGDYLDEKSYDLDATVDGEYPQTVMLQQARPEVVRLAVKVPPPLPPRSAGRTETSGFEEVELKGVEHV